jgi:hypothetical protein
MELEQPEGKDSLQEIFEGVEEMQDIEATSAYLSLLAHERVDEAALKIKEECIYK